MGKIVSNILGILFVVDCISMTSELISSGTDFIVLPENDTLNRGKSDTPFNCWEYINKDNQRTHICSCINADGKNSLIKRFLNPVQRRTMRLTFQNRLLIPWRGGAKQVSLDLVAPIFVIPFLIGIAALSVNMACLSFLSCSAFLGNAWFYLKRNLPHSKFFFMWTFCSVAYMICVFELAVDSKELLPEENLALVIFAVTSVSCFYKVKKRAPLTHVVQSTVDEEKQTSLLMERGLEPTVCQIRQKYVQQRISHCKVCQACILHRDHHSYWLDCCIAESNHRYYMAGLLFAELGLLTGVYFTLTAICHPILLGRVFNIPILLPDDCSFVFDEYEWAVAFVASIYAIIIAAYILFVLLKRIFQKAP